MKLLAADRASCSQWFFGCAAFEYCERKPVLTPQEDRCQRVLSGGNGPFGNERAVFLCLTLVVCRQAAFFCCCLTLAHLAL